MPRTQHLSSVPDAPSLPFLGTSTTSSQKVLFPAHHRWVFPVATSMRTYPSGGPLHRTSLEIDAYTYRHSRRPSNIGFTCGWSMHRSSHPGAGSRNTVPVLAFILYLHSSVLGMLLKSGDRDVAMSKSQPADALHSPRNEPGSNLSQPAVYAVTHSFISESETSRRFASRGGPSCANAT